MEQRDADCVARIALLNCRNLIDWSRFGVRARALRQSTEHRVDRRRISLVLELRAGKIARWRSIPLGAEEQPVLGFASGTKKTRFASIDYGENARKADRQ